VLSVCLRSKGLLSIPPDLDFGAVEMAARLQEFPCGGTGAGTMAERRHLRSRGTGTVVPLRRTDGHDGRVGRDRVLASRQS
jgi:hypothetical protein